MDCTEISLFRCLRNRFQDARFVSILTFERERSRCFIPLSSHTSSILTKAVVVCEISGWKREIVLGPRYHSAVVRAPFFNDGLCGRVQNTRMAVFGHTSCGNGL